MLLKQPNPGGECRKRHSVFEYNNLIEYFLQFVYGYDKVCFRIGDKNEED